MKKTVVVTGASAGIGRATAEKFIEKGYTVINLSRSKSDLDSVVNLHCDVTDEENVRECFKKIEESFGKIDVLVNNAGFGISGSVEFTKLDDAKKQFDVNVFGMITCTRYAIHLLRKTKGMIINISSAASIFAIPFQSFYSATKASVEVFTKALRNELKPFGIRVAALRLGDVHTSFTSSREKSFDGDDIYGGMIKSSVEVMEKDEKNGMKPEQIGDAVVRISEKKNPKAITTVGFQYKLFSVLDKMLPGDAVNSIVGKMYMPKK